jgi:hypothetical protein
MHSTLHTLSYRRAPLHQSQKQKNLFLTLQFVEVCPSPRSHCSLLQNDPVRVLLGESHYSSAGVVTGWTAKNHFPAQARDFLFSTPSRPVALTWWVKRPEREDDNSSPSSAEVKNGAALYTSTPQYVGVVIN